MRLRHTTRRSGFTLVELMVAAALTILIMAVLATGFQVGLQSLSHLKSAGDLADRLRTAETLLRYDLDAPHFDNGSNPGFKLLSDFRFDRPGDPDAAIPTGGFVQIRQGSASTQEGIDQDSLSSTRAITHGISFTARRTGKTPGELFAAVDGSAGMGMVIAANPMDVAVTGSTYVTDWAEVHWFLDTNRPILVNGVTTFPLCRRVRLLTKSPPLPPPAPPGSSLAEVVSADPTGNTNTLAAIATPANRLLPAALPNTPPPSRYGDDIVITNVVSFEVKPTWQGAPIPRVAIPLPSPPNPVGSSALNADFPFDDLPSAAGGVFDTATGGAGLRITGVQIKIRVYDAKNKLTRQSVVTSKL